MRIILFISLNFWVSLVFAQSDIAPTALKIDTSYAYFQYHNPQLGAKLLQHFENIEKDKVVFVHFGGSHIQAGKPIAVARTILQEKFGDGGLGFLFNYKAANTYGSILYNTSCTGKWSSRKSYQGRSAVLPIGFCGMTLESYDPLATLKFQLKNTIASDRHTIYVFFENDTISRDVVIQIDSVEIGDKHKLNYSPYGLEFEYSEPIQDISIKIKSEGGTRFRFYGLSIEKTANKGFIYHPAGVGSAAYRSFLVFDKYEIQADVLKPDVAILDFGTNDIVYFNTIDPTLKSQVTKTIDKLRMQNPEILIVLTSTQDLYFKKRVVDACLTFRELMDTLARTKDCFFWNFYDLSGGKNTIRDWIKEGYALSDGIHLTNRGYEIKGQLLALSIIQTLTFAQNFPMSQKVILGKSYQDTTILVDSTRSISQEEKLVTAKPKKSTPKNSYKNYKVRSGDTLSEIAYRYRTTVTKIKKANKLRSNLIQPGQVLKIPK
ncbi:MAG: LysM peptidoglycan-binding domain-containing protein [Bacteroidetes bacterium]|nr:LysM peptidoglycan-binding domain-containing protein [Bacteroidota bacterium]